MKKNKIALITSFILLIMSNIKSEALEQEYTERKVFLKILRSSLENNCAGVSFIMKVHAG